MDEDEHLEYITKWNFVCLLIRWKLIVSRTWTEMDRLFVNANFK